MPGKGGWTYIELPPRTDLPKKRNGTVKTFGTIDGHELKDFHIWSMKKGVFIPVKAEIRKIIKKEEGDAVELILYLDEPAPVREGDFLECLATEPSLLAKFNAQSPSEQKSIIDYISQAKSDEEKIVRMGKMLGKLEAM